jgi:hypothetical protein
LQREEELELARRFRRGGDCAAADALVRAHLGQVVSVALKYRHYGVSPNELFAEGSFPNAFVAAQVAFRSAIASARPFLKSGVAKGGYSKSEDEAIAFIFEAARKLLRAR